jgi:predicted anti-sigma-YlaC factor YlaD
MHAMTGPPVVTTLVDDELLSQILARRRRRLPLLTMALGALLVVGVAFVVGAVVQ